MATIFLETLSLRYVLQGAALYNSTWRNNFGNTVIGIYAFNVEMPLRGKGGIRRVEVRRGIEIERDGRPM